MLLKEEACEGARMRGPAGPGRRRDPTPHPTATYAVRLPQALLPPPPLVLPDEPGGGALLRGAAQPGAQSGREGGCRGVRPAERAPPLHTAEMRGLDEAQLLAVHTPPRAGGTSPTRQGRRPSGKHRDANTRDPGAATCTGTQCVHDEHTGTCTCARTCTHTQTHACTHAHTQPRTHAHDKQPCACALMARPRPLQTPTAFAHTRAPTPTPHPHTGSCCHPRLSR